MRFLCAGTVEKGSGRREGEGEDSGVSEDIDVEGGEEGFVEGVEDGVLGLDLGGFWLECCCRY